MKSFIILAATLLSFSGFAQSASNKVNTTIYEVGIFSHPDSVVEPRIKNFSKNLSHLVKEEAQIILESKGYNTILGYPLKKSGINASDLIHVEGVGVCTDKYKESESAMGRFFETRKMENCSHKIVVKKNNKRFFVSSIFHFQRLDDVSEAEIRNRILEQLHEVPSMDELGVN